MITINYLYQNQEVNLPMQNVITLSMLLSSCCVVESSSVWTACNDATRVMFASLDNLAAVLGGKTAAFPSRQRVSSVFDDIIGGNPFSGLPHTSRVLKFIC